MRSQSHPLQRLINYSHAYNGLIQKAIACSILNKIFDLAPPLLIGAAVDVVVQKQDSLIAHWGFTTVYAQLVFLSISSAIIWALESLFEYAYARIWRNLAQNIEHNLRLDAYGHLQELELAYFEERSTGGLMSILSDDINQLERFLDVGANEVLQVLTTVIIIGGIFFYLTPGVAWLAMLPMPFILWGSIAFQKRLAPRYAAVREKVGLLNGQLSNNLSGITTIKSFATEAYELGRIGAESEKYRQSNRHAIALSAAYVPLIRILIFIGFIAILLLGGIEADAGRLSLGNYSLMVFLTQRLLWPLTRLGDTLDQYQRAMASTNRVMDLLDTPLAIASGEIKLTDKGQVKGEIILNDVTFSYKDRQPAVRNLSLIVPAGKTIAIVGATGSGKSTLVKLLLRLYEINAGTITLDGIDIRDLELKDLRSCIGWVSQDVFLFHGTVAENISYGSFDATTDQIINAAQIAEADEFINQLPQGYDTIVGERGQKLSGGQRQRIAIARAVLRNPPILILDEATSAVDNETEAAIQKSLERITVNRTTIAIAHRLSTVRNAHCIYVMDYGQIVEKGTHEELLEHHEGIYAGLWRVQTGVKI
ncbi:ABC-type multidrug transport system, ATPase and permease component [Synechococcus sp. PCC 7502]|uniref:ABC transporter ATP-binding protein n=1 Tax=Synechococcus sp. PCC 7502 TaxID=1173263 RepID=UPI00029FB682|nr:ABC transporter ATP-binding protein [Synechococcus sp. PCC 7502]AFY74945.1 ABC-type multidrug transport system, ATPase and permease component [Synechococcus sp. PCC 7502]